MASSSERRQFVFGYGSLLRGSSQSLRGRLVHLHGFRRAWNVAMDNTVDLPGYKYYLDPSGRRPSVFVTFLNLRPAVDQTVNGILFEVTQEDLRELDVRERNYERTDVTGEVVGETPGTVWIYLGSAEARDRYELGRAADTAVISQGYLNDVRRGFASAGPEALAEYDATTDPPRCPVAELRRVDLQGTCPVGYDPARR